MANERAAAQAVADAIDTRGSAFCDAENAVRVLLQHVGEAPEREGLLDTPRRVVRALGEMCRGYATSIEAIFSARFAVEVDEIVVLRGIRFTSMCEHHLLPFVGTAAVAYLPGEFVVGISKLARVVEAYACRLQIQERLTGQIADAVAQHVNAKGVAVRMRAHHSCMGCRGVRQPTTDMVTSALRGAFRTDADARSEVLRLLGDE